MKKLKQLKQFILNLIDKLRIKKQFFIITWTEMQENELIPMFELYSTLDDTMQRTHQLLEITNIELSKLRGKNSKIESRIEFTCVEL